MTTFVMVIDDALVVRAILDTCLRRAGYEVRQPWRAGKASDFPRRLLRSRTQRERCVLTSSHFER
jgi:hypothetical protein